MPGSVPIDWGVIEKRRKDLGLSLDRLAEISGISKRTIHSVKSKSPCRGSKDTRDRLYAATGGFPRTPIVKNGIRIGSMSKLHLHDFELPHRSCLLLLRTGRMKCLVFKRHQTHHHQPAKLDLPGEHESEQDDNFPNSTLVRLLNTELSLSDAIRWCVRLASSINPINWISGNSHETSDLFGLDLAKKSYDAPKVSKIRLRETMEGKYLDLGGEIFDFDELVDVYCKDCERNNENRILADGLAKVLHEYVKGGAVTTRIERFLKKGAA